MSNISPMVRGYLEAALWASTDDDGEPLDAIYGIDDFAPDALERAAADCDGLWDELSHHDRDAYAETFAHRGQMWQSAAGHDLWLTRNRHGAGFWDRGLGALGERLTAAAHAMGSCDAYVGDDGQVYFS